MATIPPYSEKSPQFAEMLRQADLVGTPEGVNAPGALPACLAAAKCYEYGNQLYCKDWYECFVLHLTTPNDYNAHVDLIQRCIENNKLLRQNNNAIEG
jgi:hypothetical protein